MKYNLFNSYNKSFKNIIIDLYLQVKTISIDTILIIKWYGEGFSPTEH